MKNILLILFLIIQPAFLFSQDKVVPIEVEKGETLIDSKDFGENGFIIQTNKAGLYKKAQHFLRRYDKDLNIKWEIKIEGKGQKSFQTPNGGYNSMAILISDDIGENIYLVEDLQEQLKNRIVISKISNEGKIEHEYVINKYKKILQGIKHLFIINENLYIIGFNPKYKRKPSSNQEKPNLILFQVDVEQKNLTPFPLNLPTIENPKLSSFWDLKGISKNKIYMVFEEVPKSQEKGNCIYNISSLDFKGNLINEIKIPLNFGSHFILPSANQNNWEKFGYHWSEDFTRITKTSIQSVDRPRNLNELNNRSTIDNIETIENTEYIAKESAYSDILIDQYTGEILIFGLLGEKEPKDQGKRIFFDEIFINSYSNKGKLNWDQRIPKPKSLLEPKFPHFLVHNLFLNIDEEEINLQLGLVTTKSKMNITKATLSADILTLKYSKAGKLLNQKENKFTEFVKVKSSGESFGLINSISSINSSLFKSCLYGNPNENFIKYAITEDKPMYNIEKIINPSESGETLFISGKKSYELHYYKRKMN